jgi:solute carrier family 25 S-adenosylmethionine transporter 26
LVVFHSFALRCSRRNDRRLIALPPRLKTRLQSSSGFLASGGFSGIYRGVGSAIVGSAPGAALFFCTYEYSKSFLSARRHAKQVTEGQTGEWAAPIEHMLAASLGEVAACAVRVPTEVVKQRAQAGQYPSSLSLCRQYCLSIEQLVGLESGWSCIGDGLLRS